MQEQAFQVLTMIRSAWRFRWVGLAAAWLICLGGWAQVVTMPDEYQATAAMYVDTQSQLREILESQIIELDIESQLNQLREELLATPQLRVVARQTGLASTSATVDELEPIVARLKQKVQISVNGSSRRNQQSNLYTIQYRDTNRSRALDVVGTLLEKFIQDAQAARDQESETTKEALERERDRWAQLLSEAEAALAVFKREHADVLPSSQGDYFQRLQADKAELEQLTDDLESAQSRRDQIRAQRDAAASGVGANAGLDGSTAVISPLEQRIRDDEARLDELMLTATEQHPTVKMLRARIEELYQRLDEEAEARQRGDGVALTSDPVFQQLSLDLFAAEQDIAELAVAVGRRESQVAELQDRIDEIPAVEAELTALTRDYDFYNSEYQKSLRNLEIERLTRETSQNEQMKFSIFEPPTAPTSPVAPDRPRLLAVVLLAGLGIGGAIAFVLSQLRPVFPNQRVLSEIVGLPVLGTVSRTWKERHKARQRRAMLAFVLACLALCALFVTISAVEVAGPGFRNLLAQVAII